MTGRNRRNRCRARASMRLAAALALVLVGLAQASPAPASGNPYVVSHALRVRSSGMPATMDPHVASWTDEVANARQTYESLVQVDESGAITGLLADTWTYSQDLLAYTFTLRAGAGFASGRVADAQSVRSSVLRSLQQNGDYIGNLFDIVGAESYATGNLGADVGVRVLNTATVRFELTHPIVPGVFLKVLSLPVAAVIDTVAAQAGGATWWALPDYAAGSSPFRLAEWSPDVRVRYSRSPSRAADAEFGVVTMVIITDDAAALDAYRGGQLELYAPALSQIGAIKADPTLAADFVEQPGTCTMWLTFANGGAPFTGTSGLKLRQAIGAAISTTQYVSTVMGGLAFPADGLVPPSVPGHNPAISGLVFSPTLAQQRLSESGYAGSPPLMVQSSNLYAAQHVAGQISTRLGLGVGYTTSLAAAANLRLRGWCPDYPDADSFIYNMLYSVIDGPWTGYQNAAVDALITQSRATLTDTQRLQLLQQAEQIGVSEAAVVPLYHNVFALLRKPWLTGPVAFLVQWSGSYSGMGTNLNHPAFLPRITH